MHWLKPLRQIAPSPCQGGFHQGGHWLGNSYAFSCLLARIFYCILARIYYMLTYVAGAFCNRLTNGYGMMLVRVSSLYMF